MFCLQEKDVAHDAEIMIVGNKCDCESKRVVSKEQGQSFANYHGAKFMEISVKDSINTEEVKMINVAQ